MGFKAQKNRTIPHCSVQDGLHSSWESVRCQNDSQTWTGVLIPWISRLSSLNSASIALIFASIVDKISGRYNSLYPGCAGTGWAVSSGRHTLELELGMLSLVWWLLIIQWYEDKIRGCMWSSWTAIKRGSHFGPSVAVCHHGQCSRTSGFHRQTTPSAREGEGSRDRTQFTASI